MGVLQFNPLSSEFHDDPYPAYAKLRGTDPLHRNRMGFWFLTRHEDVSAVLRDRRFGTHEMGQNLRSKRRFLHHDQSLEHLADTVEQWLFFLNPPDHAQLRKLVGRPFTRASVASLRKTVEERTAKLLEPARQTGRLEVIDELAVPLALNTISDILGVPESDRPMIHDWTESMSRIVDPLRSIEEYLGMNQTAGDFMAYFRELFAQRRRAPKDDLISSLAEDGVTVEAEKAMMSLCINLFAAGLKTTVNYIGNSIAALIHNPEQLRLLQERPEVLGNALEELLRYDSPVQLITRVAQEDVSLRQACTIPKGSLVFLALGAANRDPECFEEPDQLKLTRDASRHVAFAPGFHVCLGATLARVEGEVAIGSIARGFRNLKIESERVELMNEIIFRGPKHLHISFDRQAVNHYVS